MDLSKGKLKFVLVCRWMFPFHQGGIPMHNGYLLKSLSKEMECYYIGETNLENIEFCSAHNINFIGIELPNFEFSIKFVNNKFFKSAFIRNGIRSVSDWIISYRISKKLEKISPDVVEFMDIHSEGYSYLKRNSGLKRKAKVVIRSHSPWGLLRTTYSPEEISGADSWWAEKREHYCFHHCDSITTPSQDLKKQLIKIYKLTEKKITVLPNLVDVQHFKPIPYLRANNKEIVILHVGRFEVAKGVITLIKSFIILAKELPNIKLINLGQQRGDAYQICIKLLEESGMIDKVKFTGFVKYDTLPEWYSKADFVVVPAEIYESFSYTVAQALACGKPVVASNIGGIPETVDFGKKGMLFTPKEYIELKEKMKLMMNELPDIKSSELHRYASEKFGIKTQLPKFLNFYTNL